nr:hypothetical protein [Tanacetum cinerariifolium]
MENSKRESIPMQEKLRLSKSQGASTPAELKRMQNVTYASAMGSIMYVVRCTRLDVAFTQNIKNQFQQNPGDLHWTTVKNILKYLTNTNDMFLVYEGDIKRELRVSCYTDVGYLTDADDLKSQNRYVFVLNEGVVDWKSKSKASSQLHLQKLRITKGARHFRAKFHYLREVIEYGNIKLEKIHTYDNLADPFTKELAFPKHSERTRNIGMLPANTRPPMLDRTDFVSWQQQIRLYCRGKENGVNILKSIDEGTYKMRTFRETLAESTEGTPQFSSERPRVYSDLNSKEKYRFSKLINDMRNIKMTMSKLQLNFKFMNNMLPEWGRYVTAVKLNRGQRDSNYDQLYAYLKQHETHAKENKMILERFSQPTVDPLALLSNVSNPQHYSPSSLASSSTQVPPPLAESIQDGRVVVQNVQGRPNRGQEMNPRGGNAVGYGGAPNRVGNDNQGQARSGQARTVKCYNCNGTGHIARNCTQPKRPQNSQYFKDKMLLMQAQENGVALDAEQLLFLAGGQDNVFDDDVDEQPVQDLALNMDNVF